MTDCTICLRCAKNDSADTLRGANMGQTVCTREGTRTTKRGTNGTTERTELRNERNYGTNGTTERTGTTERREVKKRRRPRTLPGRPRRLRKPRRSPLPG